MTKAHRLVLVGEMVHSQAAAERLPVGTIVMFQVTGSETRCAAVRVRDASGKLSWAWTGHSAVASTAQIRRATGNAPLVVVATADTVLTAPQDRRMSKGKAGATKPAAVKKPPKVKST